MKQTETKQGHIGQRRVPGRESWAMRQWCHCHKAVDQKDVPWLQQNHERETQRNCSPRLSFLVTLCVQPLKSPAEGFEKAICRMHPQSDHFSPCELSQCSPATALSLPLCFHDCASLWSSLSTQYPPGLLKDMSNYVTALHVA